MSGSIGVALYPDDAGDVDALVSRADTAMYAAKHLGGARTSFFRSEFNVQLQANIQLEQELRRALANDEFVLHFQPQVDAASGELLGCEALIRWAHPTRGLLPPIEFIGAAEQCGLISEVGAWTIPSACAQIAAWRASGVRFGSIAVDISALEFRNHRLIDTLTQAMAEFSVRPHQLEIELTESVLMTDTDTTRLIVDRLHALGLPLAVDDFGTGYSSLAYLKHLRPSKLKIDRSFIRDLPGDEDDRVLVKAIVDGGRCVRSLGPAPAAARAVGSARPGTLSPVARRQVSALRCGPFSGCSSMAERQLPKLHTRVRFPSPAPVFVGPSRGSFHSRR